MVNFFDIDKKILELVEKIELELALEFKRIDKISSHNENKVLRAFIGNRVSEIHFNSTTGYGYNDLGRDVLERVYSDVFGTDDALVRHNFVSGTHALSASLFGILRPGDLLVSVAGKPYDTICKVIGACESKIVGSLSDYGVRYDEIPLSEGGRIDIEFLKNFNWKKAKVAYIQRSRGYSLRPAISIGEIAKISDIIHNSSTNTVVFVDNCYGEFVCEKEPTDVGADLAVGSLIKNPGGGIAVTGGYVVGQKELVELCANGLMAPGLGKEVGCSLGQNRNMYMGLFFAPSVVANALKVSAFSRRLFDRLGYGVFPKSDEEVSDIVSVLQLGSEKALAAFCEGIQSGSVVDSFVVPQAWNMPGYQEKVIMAAGGFTSGSSIEISADAPLKEPHNVYLQGGLTYNSGKMCVILALQKMISKGLINVEF